MKKYTIINISVWVLTVVMCVGVMLANGRKDRTEGNYSHVYQTMAVCTEVSAKGAILTDTMGEMWYVEVPLMLGNEYLMSIDDCGTNTLEDDEIVGIWREVISE